MAANKELENKYVHSSHRNTDYTVQYDFQKFVNYALRRRENTAFEVDGAHIRLSQKFIFIVHSTFGWRGEE